MEIEYYRYLKNGTNYYLHRSDCEHCGRPFEPLHIGKSNDGWCFLLHVIPEEEINTLDDWKSRWNAPGVYIQDEYGDKVHPSKMLKIIQSRANYGPSLRGVCEWDKDKVSEPGPHGLVRYKIGDICVGHGPTWDYIRAEFS